MSRQFQSKQNTQPARIARTPCCAVCKAAGKSEAVITSHWPKDAEGKTICPTLLAQECRYCHKFGHTTKYCDTLAQVEADRLCHEKHQKNVHLYDQRVAKNWAAPVQQVQQQRPASRGQFAVFDDDSDDELVLTTKTINAASKPLSKTAAKRIALEHAAVTQQAALVAHEAAFPTLGGNWAPLHAKKEPISGISFAAMACKPKDEAIAHKQQREAELRPGFVVVATNTSSKSQAEADEQEQEQERENESRSIHRVHAEQYQQSRINHQVESALRMQYESVAEVSSEVYAAAVKNFCASSAAGRLQQVVDDWEEADNSAWD
jgi:hypothetical protein